MDKVVILFNDETSIRRNVRGPKGEMNSCNMALFLLGVTLRE